MTNLPKTKQLKLVPIFTLATALFTLGFGASTRAEVVTVEVVASVAYVSANGVYSEQADQIRAGDGLIVGTYTYDTDVIDSNPAAEIGDYQHTSSGYGLDFTTSGLRFRTDPNNVNFVVTVSDNYAGSDYLVMFSQANEYDGTNDNGIIGFQLSDRGMTAVSTTELPTDAPDISQWHSDFFVIYAANPSGWMEIGANILSLRKLSKTTVELLHDLTVAISELNDEQGIKNFDSFTGSLEAKLDSAIAALEDLKKGDLQSARGKIQAFINEVSAQKGTKLTDSQADELIAAAETIKASLA